MPRRSKGPRLYLRAGRVDGRSGRTLPDLYYIRDGSTELGTGCGPDSLRRAEERLAAYIAQKWAPPTRGPTDGPGHPSEVLVADVLTLYARERAPQLADPGATASRVKALLTWWGDKSVADVKRSTCQAYVAFREGQPFARSTKADANAVRRVTAQGARRELEDLSAAIGHWHGEHPLIVRPKVWLPLKPESPRDALTRAQAAALLKAAMGFRKGKDGRWSRLQGSSVANRMHLRRLLLIGLYTGTRPGLVPRLLWEESATAPWVDLEAGVIYRRGRDEREHRTKRRPLVKIPHRLAAHLARWRRMDERWAQRVQREAKAAGQDAPTLPNTVLRHGANAIAGRVRRGFHAIVADAGLDGEMTPHWLRHTCATWLMEAGVPVWDAAAFTGMTPSTLERHYGHHRAEHQVKARRALG
jgi:integrase